jgi:hypothetical protein
MATRTAAFRFNDSDDEVLKKLRASYGVGNDTDTVRLAMREALRVREGRRASPSTRRRRKVDAPSVQAPASANDAEK